MDEDYARILSMLDRRAAFRSVLARLPSELGVDVAWLGEVDEAGNVILGHAVQARTDVLFGLVVPPDVGLAGRVISTGQPQWVSNYPVANQLRPFSDQANREGIKGMVAVPLMHGGRSLGVLYAGHRVEATYGDLTVHALEAAAARAAAAAVVAERARHSAEVAVHEERRRLALQLHDTVGAMLFTIGAGVRRLGDDLADAPDLRDRLATIERQASQAGSVLRESLQALHAPPDSVALSVALRADCRAFEERTGIPVRFVVLDDPPPLHASRAAALAAAVREALLNVEKHAEAESVLVSVFRSTSGGVTVTVYDDGIGPDAPSKAPSKEGTGLGIAGATDRLGRVGGRLVIGRNDDGGTTVRASVPA
jgi:signal transduction histidine kinase